jgi:transcription elongation GreA/GreB family factor
LKDLKNANAEIERLKKLLEEADVSYNKCAKRFYTEAIKEFAERLKKEMSFGRYVQSDQIDNLVKEMVGDTE